MHVKQNQRILIIFSFLFSHLQYLWNFHHGEKLWDVCEKKREIESSSVKHAYLKWDMHGEYDVDIWAMKQWLVGIRLECYLSPY